MLLKMIVDNNRRDNMVLPVFMGIAIKRNKPTNIFLNLQYAIKVILGIGHPSHAITARSHP